MTLPSNRSFDTDTQLHCAASRAREHTSVRRFDEVGGLANEPNVMVPFARYCRETASGFSCRRAKDNPLSGVTYRQTADTNPMCPGEERGSRLTCTKGCSKKVPRYLYVSPYEC